MSKKANWGNVVGMIAGGLFVMGALNIIANNPKISPMWRKIARTAEGDVYQHIINGAVVTLLV
jgi:hypothetical protein